ncbi:MAG: hypothetical protein M1833_001930 [Piccolia ochrophora]|nr:MAG: hypothetical protein M1833_001930 [Piccolia ochrophora]
MPPVQQYPNAPMPVPSYHYPQPMPHSSQHLPHPPPPPRPSSSSTHSQTVLSPTTSATSPTPNVPTPSRTTSTASVRPPSPPPHFRPQYTLPLPWLSIPEEPFPSPAPRRRRRRKAPDISSEPLELPSSPRVKLQPAQIPVQPETSSTGPPFVSQAPTLPQSSAEPNVAQLATSSSPTPRPTANPEGSSMLTKNVPRPILPAIPLAPTLNQESQAARKKTEAIPEDSTAPITSVHDEENRTPTPSTVTGSGSLPNGEATPAASDQTEKTSPTAPRAAPKSWADLVRSKAPKAVPTNGAEPVNGAQLGNILKTSKAGSLANALSSFSVSKDEERKLSFLEPRGLINTGNMCYMNAILQVLIFCVPFYTFLQHIGKSAVHQFKSETPMLDALIMFMREFAVIDSAVSVDQLRMRLKDPELEQYGEPLIPEYVYEVIRQLPRFSSMRRGHQQDAEEFLGFLLEGLHEECAQALKTSTASRVTPSSPAHNVAIDGFVQEPVLDAHKSQDLDNESGWLEVGPKQKAAVTRSSGLIATESPITKIFGGKLRSELRVPGLKNSVTLEAYQPLQLDIQSPQVNNITDALKGLTHSEVLHGDFNSPRGPGATATKQVFIETLPAVLILHLKRFQYDNTGGTQKIWKKINYPLELDIPKEVYPPHKRAAHALQKERYRLISVVYHHGKNATGGHYTVDVRRQEGREWIRLDDTVIRRIRSDDVAMGGSDADPKALEVALEQHQADKPPVGSIFQQGQHDSEENSADEGDWKQVNGHTSTPSASGKRPWSGVANGSDTPTHERKKSKDHSSIKDNKVAYILFYQRIEN